MGNDAVPVNVFVSPDPDEVEVNVLPNCVAPVNELAVL